MRGTGRTKVFEELKFLLPDKYPQRRFAFFDDPFSALPHPLQWLEGERALDPVTRLFKCWGFLNEFNKNYLKPALYENDVVITDGYGLNCVLYATACVGCEEADKEVCEEADKEVMDMHNDIVLARVRRQGINPPNYLITRADVTTVTKYLRQTIPSLDTEGCEAFITKEERIIDRYFAPNSGQHADMLDASLTHTQMCERAADKIISFCIRQEEGYERAVA